MAFPRDRLIGGIDARQTVGRDFDHLRRHAGGDVPVGVMVAHQLAIMLAHLIVAGKRLDAEDDIGIILGRHQMPRPGGNCTGPK